MSKNQKASGITNIINYDNSGNISFVSGSTTLMSVSSSGAVTLTNTMSGGTATSASYAYTASSATNAFNSISASYAFTASSAINAFSASKSISSSYSDTSSFANSFNVAGNLTASNAVLSGTLTAQTLVVQTITSSIDFVTGSTRFGSLLTNTHTFTGSIYQTGSIAAFAGSVGIGTTNPSNKLTIRGTDSTSMLYLGISGASANGEAVGITFGSATYDKARIVAYNENSGNAAGYLTLWTGGSPTTTDVTEKMRITSGGDVGIGITSPAERLEVSGSLKIGNLKIQNVNGGSVGFNRNTANGAIYNSGYAAFQINGAYSGANYLDFQNYNSSGSYLGGFVLNNGNIGMGTTAPNTKLQVLGPTLTVGDQSTYALGIGNSSGYDLTLGTSTSYTHMQSWTGKPLSINSQGNNVIFPNSSTSVGIGITSPGTNLHIYNTANFVQMRIENTTAWYALYQAKSLNASNFWQWGSWTDGTYRIGQSNVGDYMTIKQNGSVGIGTTNPLKTFEVNGRMSTQAIVSGGIIAGNIASNMPSSPAYIPIFNLGETAGFSLTGFVNAASYTCFNISQIYIRKEYSGSTINAGITGLYKNACDFSIVNITYSGATYVALRFTSNPEIDVVWTGYLLTYAFNSDGSAQVWTSGVTLNSTYATY